MGLRNRRSKNSRSCAWLPALGAPPSGQGDASIVQALLDKRANVNQANANGATPLLIAAHKGHAAVVALLIAHGADLNIRGKWGTPLKEAVDDGKAETERLLREAGARMYERDELVLSSPQPPSTTAAWCVRRAVMSAQVSQVPAATSYRSTVVEARRVPLSLSLA